MIHPPAEKVTGCFLSLDGEDYYRISGYDTMSPFLMTLASDTDLWMFVTSGGGLTAGRVNAEGSLFPYETVDKLHDAHHHTGPITLIRLPQAQGDGLLWEPLAASAREKFVLRRSLCKNLIGNRLIFEEINETLQLRFRSRWCGCEEFGFVRTVTLTNLGKRPVSLSILDGLRNVLPFGAPLALLQQSSCLVDAYKRTDLDRESKLAIFSLTSKILDRAEAAEELRANVAWCHGLGSFDVCLSAESLDRFRQGETLSDERVLTGRRGNYFAVASLELPAGDSWTWHVAADVGRSHIQVEALRQVLLEEKDLEGKIEASLQAANDNLLRNVASADGLQWTARPEVSAHHFANVLFNNMRGGVFQDNDRVPLADFVRFLRQRNAAVHEAHAHLLDSLPSNLPVGELLEEARRTRDVDLQRLAHEYLPIYFGRRHGDPSRPWNRFAIHLRNPDGSRALNYEGNWRDIFQNWEALAMSFPTFLPSFIAKFVNASTIDGFNPYRINREGIDWEVPDPEHPWSHIGYWGDHQIIYLLKFLESLSRFTPGALENLLQRALFSYAEVPYRLVPYERILRNPHHTIEFDWERAAQIEERVKHIGSDGKLLHDQNGKIVHVNLIEKLLVSSLSKLSNFIPDGGIWMNTQRPEWNDANNALVGNGVSVVTLCFLRRFMRFLADTLQNLGDAPTEISNEVAQWFEAMASVLADSRGLLQAPSLPARERRRILDALGEPFSQYRDQVYAQGFSGKTTLPVSRIVTMCRHALEWIDHSIRSNRRSDGLYHAYNLLETDSPSSELHVRRLDEMLEGQVAALSSGLVDAREAQQLIRSLFASRLYREDQRSFMLYPQRQLPSFLERNRIPDAALRSIPLLEGLLVSNDDSIVARDAGGTGRFHADFTNAKDVSAALDRLARQESWAPSVARDRQAVLELFESIFEHRAFTGRSGTMYAYEGLGSVYWHMVSKLLLAVQEIALRAVEEGQPAALCEQLARSYERIRAGLGFEKTPSEYGAFPADPYSHTPAHAGARQPGMTGQVKEEILTRFGELGVHIDAGTLRFRPALLQRSEFLLEPSNFEYVDRDGASRCIDLPAGSLAFTFCQVPVVYTLTGENPSIRLTAQTGKVSVVQGDRLAAATTHALCSRAGSIARIDVNVSESALFPS